jgi:hypothetical protein
MAQPATALTEIRPPNRVTYQGITYTICTSCYEVIGSGRSVATLVTFERLHRCAAMNAEVR